MDLWEIEGVCPDSKKEETERGREGGERGGGG